MTPRLVGGIAAATFAIGILTGGAGTIVARDASTPQANFAAVMADHMGGQGMASMMGTRMASMMGTRMASMMGTGMASMMSGSMMGPDSSVPDMDGMMSGSMMVPSGPGMMSPGSSLSPGASAMPGSLHDSHHPTASPGGVK